MRLIRDADFDSLEADIYEAALVPERWTGVLDRLCGSQRRAWVRPFGAAATAIRSGPLRRRWRRSRSASLRVAGVSNNPRFEAATAKGLRQLPRFITEDDLFDSAYLRRASLLHRLHAARGPRLVGQHRGQRPRSRPARTQHRTRLAEWDRSRRTRLATLDRLRPHLARAALIAARLAFERARTAVEALAQLGFAAAAISESAKSSSPTATSKPGGRRLDRCAAATASSSPTSNADALLARLADRGSAPRPASGRSRCGHRGGKVRRGAASRPDPRRRPTTSSTAAGAILVVTRSTGRLGGPQPDPVAVRPDANGSADRPPAQRRRDRRGDRAARRRKSVLTDPHPAEERARQDRHAPAIGAGAASDAARAACPLGAELTETVVGGARSGRSACRRVGSAVPRRPNPAAAALSSITSAS